MLHVYMSISAGLKKNTSILVGTSKQFHQLMKIAREAAMDKEGEMKKMFAQAKAAKKVHNFKQLHFIVPTLYEKLNLI